MFYVTNKHPKNPDVWSLCSSGTVISTFPLMHGKQRAMAALRRQVAPILAAMTAAGDEALVAWESDAIMHVGTETDDMRIYEDPLGFREFPLFLAAQTETSWGHDGAFIVGRIDTASFSGSDCPASGVIDTSLEGATDVARMVENEILTGISVDIGKITEVETEFTEFDEEGWPTAWLDHIRGFEVAGATLCLVPAFRDTRIRLTDAAPAAEVVEPVAASGAIPVAPPVGWFENPNLEGRTRLTVTDEGRVYGHLAPWGECHIGIQGRCQEVPKSASNYGWFQLGTMSCAEGCKIPIGSITMDTGHADRHLSARPAAAHYDNTGSVIADIAVGEDDHGVWVAGAVRSTATPEQIKAFEASRLSGDWRSVNGKLDLIAILAVNTGGFPVWEEAVAADGSVESLIASVQSEELGAMIGNFGDTALRTALAPLLRAESERLAQRVRPVPSTT